MTLREAIQVYVTTEQRDGLDAISKARRWSRSTAIREALDIYLGLPDEHRQTVRLLAAGEGVEPAAIVARLVREGLERRVLTTTSRRTR